MHMDEQAGRILKEVDLDKTVVLFTSDHGDMQSDHFIWRKSVPYQGAVHVPMVLAFPRDVEEDLRKRDLYALAELRDVFPTLASAAGLAKSDADREVLARLDGQDLLCAARGDESCRREFLVLEHGSDNPQPWAYNWFAVTDGLKKYVRFENGHEQFFNLEDDVREMQNLASLPEHEEHVKIWRDRLRELLVKEGRDEAWISPIGLQPAWRREPVIMRNHPKKTSQEEPSASLTLGETPFMTQDPVAEQLLASLKKSLNVQPLPEEEEDQHQHQQQQQQLLLLQHRQQQQLQPQRGRVTYERQQELEQDSEAPTHVIASALQTGSSILGRLWSPFQAHETVESWNTPARALRGVHSDDGESPADFPMRRHMEMEASFAPW
eukprot:TRINITY_DN38607_c0_g1_i2.p1 TRINITY_DN38607_c0_g1~~TRINITY_DN38607_c0_g1_i2.p1  ORF type:complete len:380 (+),score=92.52 TRINITY_DN38607_c0_g1_i2:1040-2179(+)